MESCLGKGQATVCSSAFVADAQAVVLLATHRLLFGPWKWCIKIVPVVATFFVSREVFA